MPLVYWDDTTTDVTLPDAGTPLIIRTGASQLWRNRYYALALQAPLEAAAFQWALVQFSGGISRVYAGWQPQSFTHTWHSPTLRTDYLTVVCFGLVENNFRVVYATLPEREKIFRHAYGVKSC